MIYSIKYLYDNYSITAEDKGRTNGVLTEKRLFFFKESDNTLPLKI